jgi:2-polyprenyl-6-methoxyphenol hydroxylase-like FAD-dependent oxidoreductase
MTSQARVPVAIVGAGPVGLALALALARVGVRSTLAEKEDATSSTSKAPGVHVRTREALRQWGVEERFLATGELLQPVTLHSVKPGEGPLVTLDFSELDGECARPGLLILEQSETERLLLEAVQETGLCEVSFGAEVVGVRAREHGVELTVREAGGERQVHADYVVGCDGAGSFVRRALGLPFPGSTYSVRPLLADVRVPQSADRLPQPRAWTGPGPYSFTARLRPRLWRIVHLETDAPEREAAEHEEVARLSRRLLDVEPEEVVWSSRFRIHIRSSPRFRVGRVLLAGDAAHVHSPASGFGMNAGIQDAHNLAWKLAECLRGGDRERLLDSYEVERRAVWWRPSPASPTG